MMSTNSPGSGGNSNNSAQNSVQKGKIQQQYSFVVQQQNHQAQKQPPQPGNFALIQGADGFHAPATSAAFSGQSVGGQQQPPSSQQPPQNPIQRAMNQAAPQQSQTGQPAPPDMQKMAQPQQTLSAYAQQTRQGGATGQPPSIYSRNNGSNAPTNRNRGPSIMSSPMFASPHIPQHLMMTQYQAALAPAAFNSQPRQTQNQIYQQHNQVQFNQATHIQPPSFTTYPYFVSQGPYLPQRPNATAPLGVSQGGQPLAPASSQPGISIPPTALPPSAMNAAAAVGGPPGGQSGSSAGSGNNRRQHALKVIDPNSGMDILDEYLKGNTSRTQSPAAAVTVAAAVTSSSDSVVQFGTTVVTTMATTVDDSRNAAGGGAGSGSVGGGGGPIEGTIRPDYGTTIDMRLPQTTSDHLGTMTPVVSAISDGPAVDITPKQTQNKKKIKSTETAGGGGGGGGVGGEKKDLSQVVPVAAPEVTTDVSVAAVSVTAASETINSVDNSDSNSRTTAASATDAVIAANANISNNNVVGSKTVTVLADEMPSRIDTTMTATTTMELESGNNNNLRETTTDSILSESVTSNVENQVTSSMVQSGQMLMNNNGEDGGSSGSVLTPDDGTNDADEKVTASSSVAADSNENVTLMAAPSIDETDEAPSRLEEQHQERMDKVAVTEISSTIAAEEAVKDIQLDDTKTSGGGGGGGGNVGPAGGQSTALSAERPAALIVYDEGQWSPSNPEGKRYYTPEQLRKLSEDPRSKLKPDVKYEHILKKPRGETSGGGSGGGYQMGMGERKLATGRGGESTLLPHFAQNLSMQRSTGNQSAGTYKRVSQQGSKSSGGGGSGGGQSQGKNPTKSLVHVTLSLKEDVKLNETENAWRPSHLKTPDNVADEERITEELYKKFRCILNKLTPEKFNVLVGQVKSLKIDTDERLNGCIELVFEKAVSEPNFSVAYAQLCKQISTISVQPSQSASSASGTVSSSTAENGSDGQQQPTKPTNEQQQYMFRKTLLNRCQAEFHTISAQTAAQEKRVLRADEFKDEPERLEEYKLMLEEEERKLRWRALGTVRFIGELFKSDMLTSGIMNNCIAILMNNRHEDSLECLCKLLTTIGQRLDQAMLVDYFVKLQEIVDNRRQHKISSRVRFMIQDLIDLKKNKWVPRRPDLKPKTIVQIQKEAEAEYNNQAIGGATGSGYQMNQRDRHRGGGSGGGSSGGYSKGSSHGGGGGERQSSGGGGKINEDGWTLQNAKSGRSTAVDTKKLSVKATNIDQHTPLGTAQTYKWQPQSTNMYQALSDMDNQRPDSSSGQGKGSTKGFGGFSKGSTERERYEGRGSQHKSRENSTTRSAASRSLQAPARTQGPAGRMPYASMASTSQGGSTRSSSTAAVEKVVQQEKSSGPPSNIGQQQTQQQQQQQKQQVQQLTEEELTEIASKIRRRWTEMVLEVVEGYTKVEQCMDDIEKVPEEHRHLGIREIYDAMLEQQKKHRMATADILVHAVRNSRALSLDTYLHGLKLYMDGIDDILIDVPLIWEIIPEYLGPMILAKIITLKTLAMVSENLIKANLGGDFLQDLLRYLIFKRDAAYVLDLWEKSQVKWTDFMSPSNVDEFIKKNNFEFLINKDFTTYQSTSSTTVPLDRCVHERLKELIVSNSSYDTIEEWIAANIGTIDKNFIRILTTVVIESCLYPNYKVNGPLLEQQCRLLTRYIENKEEFEMQCLFAIQKLIFKLEHPSGLMNHIFVTLFDMEVLSSDSFKNWLDSPKEPEGKGVAVKSLHSFFTHLFINDFSDDND